MNYLKAIGLKEYPEYSYISDLPVVRHLHEMGLLHFDKPITFLVGENGTGKSTLLEAIAICMGFSAEGGSKDYIFATNNSHSDLYKYLTTIKSVKPTDGYFLRAESFYNVASYLDESGSKMQRYGGISLHEQSHGEAFLSLAKYRFEGKGLYILDEPEAALSPQRILSLMIIIHDLVKAGSQFIISTHSPILISMPNSQILQLSEKGINEITYKESESYTITKQFLDNPELMLKYLLEEEV